MRKFKIILIGLMIYFASFLASYSVFSSNIIPTRQQDTNVKKDSVKNSEAVRFDEDLPKTEQCPLNGVLYSKKQKEWWEKHRPLGIMIENHEEARPQSGLSYSDIVYEAIAEGGITRFLAMYYCQDAGFVGPVRSARTYFMDFLSEYGEYPLYAHVGGANCNSETGSGCLNGAKADALGQVEKYGWKLYNDMNQFSIGCPIYCQYVNRIGHDTATEHQMYSTTVKLWNYAEKERSLTNVDEDGTKWDVSFVPYSFADDIPESNRPASQTISFEFWTGGNDYAVKWDYNKSTNEYLRFNGGSKHLDLNNKKQLSTKNIVILFMAESRANDGYPGNLHMLYGTKGTGNALVFKDGEKINAAWSKRDRVSRLVVKDTQGNEIEFNRGKIWFEILDIGTDLTII